MRASNLPNPGKLQSSQRLRREVALAVSDIEQSPSTDRKTQLAGFFAEVASYLGGTVTPTPTGVTYPSTTNRLYGTLGDSRLGLSLFTAGRHAYLKSMGLCHWLSSASHGRIQLNPDAQTAVAGSDTNQMIARLSADVAKLKAAGVTVVFFIGGTNDYSSSITDAQTRSNILTIINRLKTEGFIPIAIAETPRRAEDSEDVKNRHYALRKWYIETLKDTCWVVDVWRDLCDPLDQRVMTATAQTTYDNQHGNPTWQKAFGNRLWHEVSHVFPLTNILPKSATDTKTPNPTMTGTGGRIATTNTTGQVATGFTIEGGDLDGLTTVMSKKTHPEYGEYQVIRVTGTPTKDTNQLSFYVEPGTAPALGEKVKGVCEIGWVGTGVVTASLNLLSFPKYFSKIDGDPYSSTTLLPTAHIGSRETPVLLMEADATAYRLYVPLHFAVNQAVDATFVISRMGALPVT